jgi:nucleoside-diphosphate-sugar epimerase
VDDQGDQVIIDGTPWRPLVHGLDIARAIIAVLQAPKEAIHNEVFMWAILLITIVCARLQTQ